MAFIDREHAARQLAEHLSRYRNRHPLVLAVPRGAVPMGEIIASRLGGDLDVVLVRKMGAPGNPELAMGAVDERGNLYLEPWAVRAGLPEEWIGEESRRQMDVIAKRRAAYTPIHPALDPHGRTVIVVDDGVATGATMVAALHLLRSQGPARLVAAVAVAPAEAVPRLAALADEVVCLETPESFAAVGEFFRDFREISDREAETILARYRTPVDGNPAAGETAGT